MIILVIILATSTTVLFVWMVMSVTAINIYARNQQDLKKENADLLDRLRRQGEGETK